MGSSWEKDESEGPNKESGEARSAGLVMLSNSLPAEGELLGSNWKPA